jgi:hypothetical protein
MTDSFGEATSLAKVSADRPAWDGQEFEEFFLDDSLAHGASGIVALNSNRFDPLRLMAATPSGFAYVSSPPTTSPTRPAGRPSSAALRAAGATVAIVCVGAGLVIAGAYPIMPFAVMAIFVAWTACATLRFSLALPGLVALVPAIGFATWTGWLTVEEVDLLVLATCAGGYAAIAIGLSMPVAGEPRHRPKLSIFAISLLGLFFASTVVALVRGIDAAGGLRLDLFDWSAGYDSPQNSLRIFKSFAFALLIAPLLIGELRKPGGFDRFGTGMTMALGLGALIVLQERLAFVGLLDFSQDYRVTGGFWEMHVGGAALDGFLALTLPFAIREALRHPNHARFVGAGIVLALATYACLVTFSRGVYAAIPVSLAVLFVLLARRRLRFDRGAVWVLLAKALVFAVVIAICGFIVFRSGGYRAVLASFIVLAAAIPVDAALRRLNLPTAVAAVVAAIALAAGGLLVGSVLPKGPYLIFALAFFATAAAVVHAERSTLPSSGAYVVGAWLWLAAAAADVARFWGGSAALHDSAVMLSGFVVLVLAASRLPKSIWPQQRREQIATVGIAAMVLGTVAVFAAGAYMGGRFSESRDDLTARLAHWTGGIGRLHGPLDWSFGKGLGRFPATSLFESSDGTRPGGYEIARRNGETFLALSPSSMRYVGFGELFRVSQRVVVRPNTRYVAHVTARTDTPTDLHIELCEKQLLYDGGCRVIDRHMPTDKTSWHEFAFNFDSGAMGSMNGFAQRPAFLAIASSNPGAILEVKRVRLVTPDGTDIVANGRFTNGTTRWFSSSDRFHLPWHIKNIVLDVLFDQGMFGLALFALLVGGAVLRTAFGRAYRHPEAPFVAAAIVGYVVVGAFDSLLDVPRVALLFYLVVITGLALRNPRAAVPAKVVVAPPIAPAAPVNDEAAERALRRQRAFGTRKRADG